MPRIRLQDTSVRQNTDDLQLNEVLQLTHIYDDCRHLQELSAWLKSVILWPARLTCSPTSIEKEDILTNSIAYEIVMLQK